MRRWLNQLNRSSRADVDCQRALFDAFATLLTRMHWEQEWDAQPYRIAAVPPRTMGKMVHQLVTANYYHFTLGPENRPPPAWRLSLARTFAGPSLGVPACRSRDFDGTC